MAMQRLIHCLVVLALLCPPTDAAGPLAFLAKEIVKSIIKSFIEDRLNDMIAAAGPCGVQMGPRVTLSGLAPGRGMSIPGLPGGMPSIPGAGGLPSIPGAGGLPSLTGMGGGLPSIAGKAGAVNGMPGMPAMPGLPGMPMGAGMGGLGAMNMGGMPPGMAEMMQNQMGQLQGAGGGLPGMGGAGGMDMGAAMQMVQAMQNAEPLTQAEIDELADTLEAMLAAMPSAAPQCKPGDIKTMLTLAQASPMGSGMLRPILEPMRKMQAQRLEAQATFARMTPAEQADYVETMAAEFRGWTPESRQAFEGMLKSDFFGMPATIQAPLLQKLQQS